MTVHAHTGVSSIANDAAYAAIVEIVNECFAEYKQNIDNEINDYTSDAEVDDDVDAQEELAGLQAQLNADTVFINNTLANFASDRNVDALINAIAAQETHVREYYEYVVNDLYSDYYNGEWE